MDRRTFLKFLGISTLAAKILKAEDLADEDKIKPHETIFMQGYIEEQTPKDLAEELYNYVWNKTKNPFAKISVEHYGDFTNKTLDIKSENLECSITATRWKDHINLDSLQLYDLNYPILGRTMYTVMDYGITGKIKSIPLPWARKRENQQWGTSNLTPTQAQQLYEDSLTKILKYLKST